MANSKPRIQISLQAIFLLMLAFAIGLAARNFALHMNSVAVIPKLPSSTTPIAIDDELIVESLTDSSIDRRVVVQTDGTIILPLLNRIKVSGQDVASIEKTLSTAYSAYYKDCAIQVYRPDVTKSMRNK